MSGDTVYIEVPDGLLDWSAFTAGEVTDEDLVRTARWLAENHPDAPETGRDFTRPVFVIISDIAVFVTGSLLETAQIYGELMILDRNGRNVAVVLNPGDYPDHVLHDLAEVLGSWSQHERQRGVLSRYP